MSTVFYVYVYSTLRKDKLQIILFFFSYIASVDIAIDDLRWSISDSINITLGPENTVYCKIEDPFGHTVYDDFGQCKIVLTRVTLEHDGLWHMYIGVPGNVLLQTIGFVVSVLERGKL